MTPAAMIVDISLYVLYFLSCIQCQNQVDNYLFHLFLYCMLRIALIGTKREHFVLTYCVFQSFEAH